ncbi:hypothetical protein L2E82_41434 [Cichorium intybus]|uniref:Uncharacterized protein n=1 Tax=Cichorium intybus TaxID=13427 RepID=A0ACB9AMC8_CICIN|nr:hypothetical protein L2E82_41434 [Cichorium intybus]
MKGVNSRDFGGIPVTHPILVAPLFPHAQSCDLARLVHMLHAHPIATLPHPCQFLHTSADNLTLAGKSIPLLI